MAIQPLFILSVTRSGSTLTQRILGSYREISTRSEPWILLPLLSSLRPRMPGEADWHALCATAIRDFAQDLPGGRPDYDREIRDVALRLYERAADPHARYFLDKTPAYQFVVDELLEVFPDAKIIYLWRNPLGLLASMMNTWEDGRWSLDVVGGELFNSLPALVAARERTRDRSVALRFEDVVEGDHSAWRRVMTYLDVQFRPESLTEFSQLDLNGAMGDRAGALHYTSLSTAPLTKWRAVINTPIRRAWTRRYLTWLGAERLQTMGYRLDALLDDLDSVPLVGRGSIADVRSLASTLGREVVRAQLRRAHSASSWRHILTPVHTPSANSQPSAGL